MSLKLKMCKKICNKIFFLSEGLWSGRISLLLSYMNFYAYYS